MKITVPDIVEPLDLGGFHPDFKGQALQVWVNIPAQRTMEYFTAAAEIRILSEQLGALTHGEVNLSNEERGQCERIAARLEELVKITDAYLTDVWSRAADPFTHISAAELRDQTSEGAPGLFNWCNAATLDRVLEWRKKK